MLIDARGKACPQPVILAKQQLDAACGELTLLVDNAAAAGNLERLAAGRHLKAETVREEDGLFRVQIHAAAALADTPAAAALAPGSAAQTQSAPGSAAQGAPQGYAVFVSRDHLGAGHPELGATLLAMALYTLAESESPPRWLLFMNSGVKLPAGGDQAITDSLDKLSAQGCEILVCGACLDFYSLSERLRAGRVSNMYDILSVMQRADKVISL